MKYDKRYANEGDLEKQTAKDDDAEPGAEQSEDDEIPAAQPDMSEVELAIARAGHARSKFATPPSNKYTRKRSGTFESGGESTSGKKAPSVVSVAESASASEAPPADTSQAAKGKAATKLEERLGKLNLQQTLNGVKLGLQKHHAQEYLKGVTDALEQVQIKAHLALYEAAVKLCPTEVKNTPDEEIVQCIQTLEGSGIIWTESLMWHLWRRRVKKALTGLVSEASHDGFHAFWSLVRPYERDAGDREVNIRAVTLCNIVGSKEAKLSEFMRVLLNELLLPALLQGESLATHVAGMCKKIAQQVDEEVVLLEIDEHYIPSLSKLKDTVSGLSALVSGDLSVQFEYKDHITKFRSGITSKSDDIVVKFAKGLGGVHHYRTLMDSFLARVTSIEIHEEKIRQVRLFFQQANFKYGQVEEKPLVEALKDLTLLAAELPDLFMQGLRQNASTSLWSWWESGQAALSKEGADKQASSVISNVLAECAIAFPVEERWRTAQEQLGDHIRKTNGWEKTKRLMEAVEAVITKLNDADGEEERLSALSTSGAGAAGLALQPEELKKLQEAYKVMIAKMEETVAELSTDSHMILQCMEAIYKFNSQVGSGDMLSHCKAVLDFKMSKLAWEVLVSGSIDNVVKLGDKSMEVMADLMRHEKAARALTVPGCWGYAFLEKSLVASSEQIHQTKELWLAECRQMLETTCASLENVAGGADNGASWSHKLGPSASWEEALEHGKVFQDKAFVERIKDRMDIMLEALYPHK